MKEKHPEEYAKAVENQKKQQTTKALHGAKLNYFKNLKHQCADDEELYYYKKGGIVDCGCKKKNGGDIEPKKECGGGVAKFKMDRAKGGTKFKKPQIMDQAAKDSIEINSREGNDEKEATRPGSYKPNPKYNSNDPNSRTHIWVPDRTKAPYNKKKEEKKQPTYQNQNMSNKKGGTIEEFKKAKCGSKMKKHKQGGSIFKFQKGTPEKGIKYHIGNPYISESANAEYQDINSVPDKFGRHVDISRQVTPRNDGTLNNDTMYLAFIHDKDHNVNSSGYNCVVQEST